MNAGVRDPLHHSQLDLPDTPQSAQESNAAQAHPSLHKEAILLDLNNSSLAAHQSALSIYIYHNRQKIYRIFF